MKGLEKRDKRRRLCRSQIFSVRWHVAASLDYLSYQLILGKPHGDAVKRRPSLTAQVA
jgi:hypothetical protein